MPPEADRQPAPAFLESRTLRLLLFGGKGGVGKTTCSAAAALRLARSRVDERFLLVSTDPAHSLLDSLAGRLPPANLQVLELDAQECLAAFRTAHGRMLQEIAVAGTFLDGDDIGRFLELSLPGLDELMAFLQISDWVAQGQYACIIVDTAPSGHTLRLLGMPALLRRWLCMLDALLAKRRCLRKVFGRSVSPDRLDKFLQEWWSSLRRMNALLRDGARCQFVAVTVAEPLSVRETAALERELLRAHISAGSLVINQLHQPGPCAACTQAHAREQEQVRELYAARQSREIWAVDLFPEEVRGAERLQGFWEQARRIACLPAPVAVARGAVHFAAEAPATPPSPEIRLALFAGKGGVGKTTLACATAAAMARDFPQKRILLFSTDPAHSLSACLEVDAGPQPVHMAYGLSAMEIDAHAEFEALKNGYARDIEDFLRSVSTRLDLTFDRVVLEKLMDLAPPGLDEIMALARMLDLMEHRRYDLFVLDSAATGHFVRLMELPALVDEWLKTFFVVLLKYQGVFELPRFAAQLVELSKHLKNFRKLLADSARAVVYAVTIPTRMAFEETSDLLAACERLNIAVPALFLNLLTPPGDCALCRALRRRELDVVENFRLAFPRQQQVLVYRQQQPAGLAELRELAHSMYRSRPEVESVYAAT